MSADATVVGFRREGSAQSAGRLPPRRDPAAVPAEAAPLTSQAEQDAVNALEKIVAPFVNDKRYEVLLALERQGVNLTHSLAVAAYGGKHEQVEWLLGRGAVPDSRVLRFAIHKGRQMAGRFLPLVKCGPEHADAAANVMWPDLLERIIDGGARPTVDAYRWVGYSAGGGRNLQATLDVLMHKGEPWRVGTQALLHVMHHLTAQQVAAVLSAAPLRFNRDKVLARAIRCGNEAVAREVAGYGFGAKVTGRVALRAVGEKLKHQSQDGTLEGAVSHLVRIHRDTGSARLPVTTVSRVLSLAVRRYMASFWGDERERTQQHANFLRAFEQIVSLGEPDERAAVLSAALIAFRVDRVESPEAKRVNDRRHMWPCAFGGFRRFNIEFERHLQKEIDMAAAVPAKGLIEGKTSIDRSPAP